MKNKNYMNMNIMMKYKKMENKKKYVNQRVLMNNK